MNTHLRRNIFSHIRDGVAILTPAGEILLEEWCRVTLVRENVRAEDCAIMPDHFHGILAIRSDGHDLTRVGEFVNRSGSLGAILSQLKSRVTKRIRRIPGHSTDKIWQDNYHDRIIRTAYELRKIREYIRKNPAHFGRKHRKGQ
ncbi:MAG: hypothetical protein C0600_06925 [Ignavibacteria bacterium]|nr:MAG: hypothetical protein C0600_06925 [Ignavibacteria bacterium]